MSEYTKLSNLVGSTITIHDVQGFMYKRWDASQGKMLTSETYQEGFAKKYKVETDKGILDVGSGQMGTLLEACQYKGKSDLIGKTFEIKSNGKTNLEIRYYFNLKTGKVKTPELNLADDLPPLRDEDKPGLSEIPF